jgi:putative transposase
VHRRYTKRINHCSQWTGRLWQGRFASVAMDEDHLLHAFRYVTMNPVRARQAAKAEDWRWSSAASHLRGKPDGLTKIVPALSRIADFKAFLQAAEEEDYLSRLRLSETTGRPEGQKAWVEALETETGRRLWP